jgi:hypothetical protein
VSGGEPLAVEIYDLPVNVIPNRRSYYGRASYGRASHGYTLHGHASRRRVSRGHVSHRYISYPLYRQHLVQLRRSLDEKAPYPGA